jgi:hypothetical protein
MLFPISMGYAKARRFARQVRPLFQLLLLLHAQPLFGASTLIGVSSNHDLLPESGISVSWDGSSYSVTLQPLPDRSGTAIIHLVLQSDSITNRLVPPFSNEAEIPSLPNQTNTSPVLSDFTDQRIEASTIPLTLSFSVFDEESPADTLAVSASSYDPSVVASESILVDGSGESRVITIPLKTIGSTFITLTASDGELTTTRTFLLEITPADAIPDPNRPPLLHVPSNQIINELNTLVVTNSADDPDLPTQTLAFALVSAPSGVNLDPRSGILTWTPTEAQGPGTNLITLRVFDNGSPSLSATQSFLVTVREANSQPTLAPINDQTIDELALLTITNAASDSDLPVQTLTFALIAAPYGVNLDPITGILTLGPRWKAMAQAPILSRCASLIVVLPA